MFFGDRVEAVAGSSWADPAYGRPIRDDEPGGLPSRWSDAKSYVSWLAGRPVKKLHRLLTEAEWGAVARAGNGGTYPWGEDPSLACKYANIHDKSSEKLAADKGIKLPYGPAPCDDGYAGVAPVGKVRTQRLRSLRHHRQRLGVGRGLLRDAAFPPRWSIPRSSLAATAARAAPGALTTCARAAAAATPGVSAESARSLGSRATVAGGWPTPPAPDASGCSTCASLAADAVQGGVHLRVKPAHTVKPGDLIAFRRAPDSDCEIFGMRITDSRAKSTPNTCAPPRPGSSPGHRPTRQQRAELRRPRGRD